MNDDTISRKAVIDTVHAAVRPFIADDGDEMNDADKMVLSINKAVCNAIKALPTAPNTFNALSALDCVARQAAIDEIDEWIKAFRENGHKESAADACLIQDGIIQLPSAQPEIIYCKDCMHNGSYDTDCPIDWNGKEYCSFAERREDASSR